MADLTAYEPNYGKPTTDQWDNSPVANILDPFGFWRTVGAGGNPLDPKPFATRGQTDTGQSVANPATIAAFMQRAWEAADAGIIDHDTVMAWDDAMRSGNPQMLAQLPVYQQTLQEAERSFQTQKETNDEKARAETYRQNAMADLTKLESQYTPQFQADINRYTNGGNQLDPNFIYRDPTYAKTLSAADNAINQSVARVRNNAALNNANSGIATSGQSIGATTGAELQGEAYKQGERSDLVGSAMADLQAAKDRLFNFRSGVADQRRAIDAGYQPSFAGLTQLVNARPMVDLTSPYATSWDSYLANEGVKLNRDALNQAGVLGVAGIASDSFNNATNAGSDLIGKYGKFLA